MQDGQPSRTALVAAALRAAHQTLDDGQIFKDAFARLVLGSEADTLIEAVSADPTLRRTQMRSFMAARSRFAEDALQPAVSRGVRQAVILGAGLDTFAIRNPHRALGLQVFEVDHPRTQSWKRRRLAQMGIALPAALMFAPIDLAQQGLAEGLVAAGFQPVQPAFFIWLGVVPYLPREAVATMLKFIASVPGPEVVFDYAEPLANYAPELRAGLTDMAARTAALGEPWLSYFEPAELAAELHALGFRELHDLGVTDLSARYPGAWTVAASGAAGPHVMHAGQGRA